MSSTTYRLRGISGGIKQATEISNLLRETWRIPKSTEVTTHSLATDPSRPESKTATVSFSDTPELLRSPGKTEWVSPINNGLTLDTHFYGFTPLHSDADADCFLDCIALSGLGGHAFGSFKTKGGSFMWLRDALPKDLRQTRILIYGHDARTADHESFQAIADLGLKFQESITGIRPSGKGPIRPLILIGHSLGGLILKQAIVNMHESPKEDDKLNLLSLRAALFFGVPSLGMNIESLIPMSEGKASDQLVKSLQRKPETLHWPQRALTGFLRKFSRYWYYETKQSPTAQKVGSKWAMTGPPVKLVDIHSATDGLPQSSESDGHYVYPINNTHSEMVKFPNEQDGDYSMVCKHLNRIKEEVFKSDGSVA